VAQDQTDSVELIHSAYSHGVHTIAVTLAPFAASWAIATAVTYILTGTSIFYWLRIRLLKRFRRSANATATAITKMPADYPAKLRNRARTRYWLQEATTHLPSCPVCVGWWMQALGILAAYAWLGFPAELFTLPVFIVLPAMLCTWWMAGIIVTGYLPMTNHMGDPFNVDPVGDET
jgi:hypothetical protein